MEWLIDYWFIVLAIVALIVVVIVAVYKFIGLPTKEQVAKIKEWLLYAVMEAEKKLGEKTGREKLRMVYDMFLSKFSITAKLISFDTFSNWVDEALEDFRQMLEGNEKLQEYVNA